MANAAALDPVMSRLMHLGGELVTTPGQPLRKFDLAHMRALLAALGDPHHRFPSILIAGTNGKGSTAATLASILEASDYRTGLYTSPHLRLVNERIRIAGLPIQDAEFFAHLARVEAAAATLVAEALLPGPPSFFETLTAVAMLAFADRSASESVPSESSGANASTGEERIPATRPVDVAILEVGMGGRLDATNVVDPLFSVITDISLDHTEWLGPTITAIAREKAGILRQDGVMITLPQHPEANQALGEVAVALNVRGVNAADFLPGREASSSAENHYVLTLDGQPLEVDSPLRGQHQQRNLALVLAAVSELRNQHGYKLPARQVEQGIRTTNWPGRLQQVNRPGQASVLLDVAHNPAGAWALRAALSQLPESTGSRQLIFGCMRDKAFSEMAQILFPVFDHVWLVELPSSRAASAADLVSAAERTGTSYTVSPDPQSALISASARAATLSAGASGSLIVASGSVILVGALQTLLA